MNEFFKYIIEWSLGSIFLYGIYFFFLKNETYFRLNRVFLIGSLIVSAVIPLLHFSAVQTENGTLVPSFMLETITVNANGETSSQSNTDFSGFSILFKIYIAVSITLSLKFILQLIKIVRLISSTKVKKVGNKNYVFTSDELSNFTFLNYIFLKEETKGDSDFDQIIKHETIHAKQWHSLDIIFTEIVLVLQWFNPVIWLYRKALKQTHEYLADEGVLEQGFDSDKYQLLLVEKQIGVQPGLANNFNKSLTLKRLRMMNKVKSTNLAKLKFLALVPVVALMVIAFACDKTEEVTDNEKV